MRNNDVCVGVFARRGDGWRMKGQLGSVIVSLIERSTMTILYLRVAFLFSFFPVGKQLAIVNLI